MNVTAPRMWAIHALLVERCVERGYMMYADAFYRREDEKCWVKLNPDDQHLATCADVRINLGRIGQLATWAKIAKCGCAAIGLHNEVAVNGDLTNEDIVRRILDAAERSAVTHFDGCTPMSKATVPVEGVALLECLRAKHGM